MAQATTMSHPTKTTLRPLHDRVLVKRLDEQVDKHGSIIIPDTAKEKPQTAKVLAVGNGRVNDTGDVFPLDVKAGDYVLVGDVPDLPDPPARVLRFMPVMDDVNELTEPSENAAVPSEPAPPIDSRFLFVDVAALRAKQLRRGARVRITGAAEVQLPKKPERLAMEEVRRGLVYYDMPPPKSAAAEDEA